MIPAREVVGYQAEALLSRRKLASAWEMRMAIEQMDQDEACLLQDKHSKAIRVFFGRPIQNLIERTERRQKDDEKEDKDDEIDQRA